MVVGKPEAARHIWAVLGFAGMVVGKPEAARHIWAVLGSFALLRMTLQSRGKSRGKSKSKGKGKGKSTKRPGEKVR
jgi:hypothetical protein